MHFNIVSFPGELQLKIKRQSRCANAFSLRKRATQPPSIIYEVFLSIGNFL